MPKRAALVLNGGGVTAAAFEIGCLAALDERFGRGFVRDFFQIYVGASAGAIVASLTAGGIPPGDIRQSILAGARSRLNFRRSDIYRFDARGFAASCWEASLGLGRLARDMWERPSDVSLFESLHVLQEQLPSGVFTVEPLRRYVEDVLTSQGRGDQFAEIDRTLLVPAIDLDRGTRVVFGAPGHPTVPISQAVTASCTIPGFFQPYEIDGHHYIDGAVSGRCHLDLALEHDVDLLLVVNPLVPVDSEPTILPTVSRGRARGVVDLGISFVSDQSLRIEASERLEASLSRAAKEHPDVEILRLEPSRSDTLPFLNGPMSFEARDLILESAYGLTQAWLREHESHFRPILRAVPPRMPHAARNA